ncbi:MAG TPA: hypothetical protein VJN69_11535 [Candidatus Acidoferrales bacterium]|nr:hypothetical protein [Candidatus Acidoferrales bacterium]
MDQARRVFEFYKNRVHELGVDLAETSKHRSQAAGALIILCFVGVVLLYLAVSRTKLPFWTLGLLAPIGWFIIKRFGEYRREALKLLALLEYYENGVARVELKWESLDTGSEFNDPEHFYATDLDLFGRGSLFQVLCSARTKIGRETLANWMKSPASEDELAARRTAISELRTDKGLRESLASAGKSSVSDCRAQTFRDWVQESVRTAPFPTWAAPMAFLLALVLCALPFLYWFGPLTLQQL